MVACSTYRTALLLLFLLILSLHDLCENTTIFVDCMAFCNGEY